MSEQYFRQSAHEFPETFPVHARADLGIDAPNVHFDTVLMGQGTYETALKLGITRPYPHLQQYIFSRTIKPSTDPSISFVAGDPVPVVKQLKAEDSGKDIWLCGGTDLAGRLIREVDELIIKLSSLVVGEGIPLFGTAFDIHRFRLTDSQTKEGGVILLRYLTAKNR